MRWTSVCMYVLTIRDGLNTRHIGPYESPQQAADHLDRWLENCGERAHWQIHQLVPPTDITTLLSSNGPGGGIAVAA